MTDSERILWSRIRRKQVKGYQFYRQKAIASYIVDFYCPAAGIVIELDGSQHYTDEGRAADTNRDEYMKKVGLRVIRFRSSDVFDNIDGVLQKIHESLPESRS